MDYEEEFGKQYSNDYWHGGHHFSGDIIDNFQGEGWEAIEYDSRKEAEKELLDARKKDQIIKGRIIKARNLIYLVYLDN